MKILKRIWSGLCYIATGKIYVVCPPDTSFHVVCATHIYKEALSLAANSNECYHIIIHE